MCSNRKMKTSTENCLQQIEKAAEWIKEADCIIIGAGAGLSASAGFEYSGKRFEKYIKDLENAYGYQDMYSGGFYPYPSWEAYWAFFSRMIYLNRYMNPPISVYETLLDLVRNKDYFALTTNVDHMFQKAGFDKQRIFYTQGDYGLFQTQSGRQKEIWDNEEAIKAMVEDQGFVIAENGELFVPAHLKREISSHLVPKDLQSGELLVPNLRIDETFVQDAGWNAAEARYHAFLEKASEKKTLFLELGVGFNTPGIIKYPFQSMAQRFEDARMISIDSAYPDCRRQGRFMELGGDLNAVLRQILVREQA